MCIISNIDDDAARTGGRMSEMSDETGRRAGGVPHGQARLAGFFYAIVVVTGLFSLMYAPDRAFAGEVGPALVQSIAENEALLRWSIAAELACYVAFLALALALHKLLAHAGQFNAMLMAGLAISSVPFGFANITHLLEILRIVDAGAAQTGEAAIVAAYQRYQSGLWLQNVPWSLWLTPFGWLVFRSGFLPRLFGLLLMLAGIGGVAHFLGRLAIETYDPSGPFGSVLSAFGFSEILICIWLLVFGARRLPLLK
jgi:hypothetical protein